MVDVQEQRSYEVNFRFISLWILNEDTKADWYHEEYRAAHYRGHQGLRIADQIRLEHGGREAVARWYATLGTAIHRESRRDEFKDDPNGFFAGLLESAGFPAELASHADDDSHDAHIRAETELALSRTGPDVGTPILTFKPDTDREGSFFGPVIAKAPTGAEARELWDAIETIATSGVAELKRSLRGTPDFT